MSEAGSGIEAGDLPGVVIIRVNGRGTHLNSHLFKDYAARVLEEGKRRLQIDLSPCGYMDSTFLGMLAGLGVRARDRSLAKIRVVNASERVRGMIEGLGIDVLFEMDGDDRAAAGFQTVPPSAISPDRKSRDMLEAHETLVAVSPFNEVKFRDVIALLREHVDKAGGR